MQTLLETHGRSSDPHCTPNGKSDSPRSCFLLKDTQLPMFTFQALSAGATVPAASPESSSCCEPCRCTSSKKRMLHKGPSAISSRDPSPHLCRPFHRWCLESSVLLKRFEACRTAPLTLAFPTNVMSLSELILRQVDGLVDVGRQASGCRRRT